ncbi:MAG: signal peptide peptidase SppA [Deltaproteobacteria bacterium]|nr:signal peptide peptidase SppA [Deltaproteobacteria bacterium]MBW2253327.1 signal peptide peptidase SppA [Deltaproteobacteria bacterium]
MTTEPVRSPNRQRTTRVTQVLLAVTVLGLLVFVGSIGLTMYFFTRADRGDVSEGSFLLVRLSGVIPDAPVRGGLFLEPEDFPPVASEVAQAIRKAADDERIDGVYLRLDNPEAGIATYQEIRAALGHLRQAGKPCVVYSELYTTGSYYLASACDKVVIAPSGLSLVSGLSISITYYAETFEKIGVDPEYEHVGEFKSAVEPYERTGPSEAATEMYEALLDSLYDQLVAGIAEGRGKAPDEVRSIIDALDLTPEVAMERGLVDAMAFPDGVVATLPQVGDDNWAEEVAKIHEPLDDETLQERFTPLGEYVKELRAEQRKAKKKVAVIHAEGPITSGDDDGGLFGDSVLADGPFRKWMRQARENEDVVAVVLRVNSPGGSGLASDMMWHEVERLKAAGKPVVVSMGDYAASGGYYIACNADHIVAQPATLTGSIGVLGGKFNVAGTFEKVGLHTAYFKRGELADLLSPTKGFSEEGRETFRRYLENYYGGFITKVAEGRGMEYDAVHAVAQGRVWTGEQALGHRLVDQLGGLDVAVAKAAELGGVEAYGILRLPEQKGFLDLLMEDLAQARTPALTVEIVPPIPGAEEALREVLLVTRMASDNGVLLYLPGNPTIR